MEKESETIKELIERLNGASGKNTDDKIMVSEYQSPLGEMVIAAVSEGICLLEFNDRIRFEKQFLQLQRFIDLPFSYEENFHSQQLKKELDLYFGKQLREFSVPLVFTGTEFQQKVFKALLEIPYGKTVNYKQQSEKFGDVKAIRAVATANGSNKIAVVVPCHRVIGRAMHRWLVMQPASNVKKLCWL